MDSKTQFISQKDLASWWSGISQDPRFDRVLLHASGVALESIPSAEQRTGLLKFKDILLTLSDAEAAPVQFTTPGLLHDLDVARKVATPPAVKQPEKPKKK